MSLTIYKADTANAYIASLNSFNSNKIEIGNRFIANLT